MSHKQSPQSTVNDFRILGDTSLLEQDACYIKTLSRSTKERIKDDKKTRTVDRVIFDYQRQTTVAATQDIAMEIDAENETLIDWTVLGDKIKNSYLGPKMWRFDEWPDKK